MNDVQAVLTGQRGWAILQGDVFSQLPLIPPGSVDVCVTSPPYWALRSYLPKGHALKPLELGSEKTPAEYVAGMVRVFRLVREALAEHGTVWLNIGDSYASGEVGRKDNGTCVNMHGIWSQHMAEQESRRERKTGKSGLPSGNLCLIPQRLAIALQDDGWIVRSVIVWHKPAPMPTSVAGWRWTRCRVKMPGTGWGGADGSIHPSKTLDGFTNQRKNSGGVPKDGVAKWSDCPGCAKCEKTEGLVLRRGSWRPTSSWEPILMLAKSRSYFADGEAVKQPPAAATVSRDQYTRVLDDPDEQFAVRHDHETVCDGANLRDVWSIASEALKEKHYASFPTELVRRCLLAGTSAHGYCRACGKPWARVIEGGAFIGDLNERLVEKVNRTASCGREWAQHHQDNPSKTVGWRASCQCTPSEPRPAVVLDPFCGSGRTGITARRLGLNFLGIELNPEYVRMASELIANDNPMFNGQAAEETPPLFAME